MANIQYYDVILKPVVTEKSMELMADKTILDENEQIVGMMNRYHLLRPRHKRVVLVDHNETSQSVPGLEEARIVAIIDHHRIADIETPCGCCDDDTLTLSGSAELSIPKCMSAEVVITKSVSKDSICCDEEIDYLITLTNTGNVDATNVVVTDTLPANFVVMEIHKENNGNHYQYDESEYDLSDANLLTLPNETGTIIEVPTIAPGVDNTTRIRIHGHM